MIPTFTHPLALLLLPLAPLLLWLWRRRGAGSLRYADVSLLEKLPPGRSRVAQRAGWMLRGLGLLALVLALAGPRWPDRGSRIATEGIALAMVVDVSRSMSDSLDFAWEDQKLSRLEGMKKIFRLFVDGGTGPDGKQLPGRPQDLVSLITYARRPDTVCPLTLDHAALLKMLDRVEPPVVEANSNLGDALAWAVIGLNKAKTRRKVIVILTDGESNEPSGTKPRQAAQLAGNLKIPIYAIDANPDASTDEQTEKGRKTLEAIAQVSQGQCFRASGAEALTGVYAQIDQLERSRIDSFRYSRYYDAFFWFGLTALMSWLSVVFLESTVWRKVP